VPSEGRDTAAFAGWELGEGRLGLAEETSMEYTRVSKVDENLSVRAST
jgi:hypothetical protein